MEELMQGKGEIFSKAVRAGKRTYFFDVKETKSGEKYLTITESKRRFVEETGRFVYDKHKIFLYQEDFEKFITGIEQTVHFVKTGERPPEEELETLNYHDREDVSEIDLEFDSLGNNN